MPPEAYAAHRHAIDGASLRNSISRCLLRALLCVLVPIGGLAAASVGPARADEPSPPGDGAATTQTSDLCGGPLRLDGASAEPDSERVHFDPAWRTPLSQLASCLQAAEHQTFCAQVRGQYDDRKFSPALRTALGSEGAAQVHRARARADAVMSELVALGVGPERIVSVPPATSASYRGVAVTVVSSCRPTRESVHIVAGPQTVSTNETWRTEGAAGGGSSSAAAGSPLGARPARRFSLEGQAVGGLMAVDPNDVWYAALRPRFGYHLKIPYIQLFGGLALGQTDEHRVGFEWGLVAGVRPVHWLQLGLVGAARMSSSRAMRAWLEQTWSVGIEAAEQLWQGENGSFWLTQSVWPLSYRKRRAAVIGDQLVDTRDTTSYAPRLELGFAVRTMLF